MVILVNMGCLRVVSDTLPGDLSSPAKTRIVNVKTLLFGLSIPGSEPPSQLGGLIVKIQI